MTTVDLFCVTHSWHYEAGDYCPECKGAADARAEIIEMLKNEVDGCFCPVSTTIRWTISKIGGEKYEERCHGCDYLLPDLQLEWINGEELVMICADCLKGENDD